MFGRGRGRHAHMEEDPDRHDGADESFDEEPSYRTTHEELSHEAAIMGPFDSHDVPRDGRTRVDLGSLRIPISPSVNIHPQLENDHVTAIVLVSGSSALQVIPFAAPRDGSAWDDIRHDLRIKLAAENYSPRECEGEFGFELLANLPSQNGRQLVRFLGIDGPRWFIRAMFTGAAASDPLAGKPLIDVLSNMIVVRGSEPRPVRDPLPMRLPEQPAAPAKAPEQPRARLAAEYARRGAAAEREASPAQRTGERPYLANATYRERYGPVADETIEIRGLPFIEDDELALTR